MEMASVTAGDAFVVGQLPRADRLGPDGEKKAAASGCKLQLRNTADCSVALETRPRLLCDFCRHVLLGAGGLESGRQDYSGVF